MLKHSNLYQSYRILKAHKKPYKVTKENCVRYTVSDSMEHLKIRFTNSKWGPKWEFEQLPLIAIFFIQGLRRRNAC